MWSTGRIYIKIQEKRSFLWQEKILGSKIQLEKLNAVAQKGRLERGYSMD